MLSFIEDSEFILENDLIELKLIQAADFELLFNAAADPLIWQQHPNPNRYQREEFQIFFDGAIKAKTSFIIWEKSPHRVIGSSRFYDYDKKSKTVSIGYTFLIRDCWGHRYNSAVKKLMLDYAFSKIDRVFFHIGANNIRSQKAIEKIGAKKISEKLMQYQGETKTHLNYIYSLDKKDNCIQLT